MRPVATDKWNVVNNGRSHAVVLTMPKEVTPAEYGIEEQGSGVSKMAFVAPGKGDKIFRPKDRILSLKGTSLWKAIVSSSTLQLPKLFFRVQDVRESDDW